MMAPRLPHAGYRLLPGAGPGVVQGQYWGLQGRYQGLQGQQWGLWLVLGHWGQYWGLWSILGSLESVTGSLVSPRVSLSGHQQASTWSLPHKDVEGHEKTGHRHSHVQAGPNHSSLVADSPDPPALGQEPGAQSGHLPQVRTSANQ